MSNQSKFRGHDLVLGMSIGFMFTAIILSLVFLGMGLYNATVLTALSGIGVGIFYIVVRFLETRGKR